MSLVNRASSIGSLLSYRNALPVASLSSDGRQDRPQMLPSILSRCLLEIFTDMRGFEGGGSGRPRGSASLKDRVSIVPILSLVELGCISSDTESCCMARAYSHVHFLYIFSVGWMLWTSVGVSLAISCQFPIIVVIMNPQGVSCPPPPGYTHAQVQQMLQAQQQVKK